VTAKEIASYRTLANLEASEVAMALRKALDEVERLQALAEPLAAEIERLRGLSFGVKAAQ
jgi:hypothetical protein